MWSIQRDERLSQSGTLDFIVEKSYTWSSTAAVAARAAMFFVLRHACLVPERAHIVMR